MNVKKRMLSILLSVTVVIVPMMQVPAYATDVKNPFASVGQEKAETCAKQLIVDTTTSDFFEDWPWNSTTKIQSTVPMYDYDGNVNAYLFRLNTDGVQQGYIVVNATEGSFGVESYSGSGDFAADIMAQRRLGHPMQASDKIIHHSMMDFAVQKNGQLLNLESNQVISASKSELKQSYAKALQLQAKSNQIEPASSWDGNYTVKGASGWSPYVTSDFPQDNKCAPTAATNVIHYWGTRSSDVSATTRSRLWSGQVYLELANLIGFHEIGGSNPLLMRSALINYGKNRNAPALGDDQRYYSAIDWAFIVNAIKSNIPVMLCTNFAYDSSQKYDFTYHMFVAVGYNRSSSTIDLLVVDGWHRIVDTVYHYNNAQYLQAAAYARWA